MGREYRLRADASPLVRRPFDGERGTGASAAANFIEVEAPQKRYARRTRGCSKVGTSRRTGGRTGPHGPAPATSRPPGTPLPGRHEHGRKRARERALPGALLTTLVFATLTLALPGLAQAHKGSPNYRSTVRSIQPAVPGLKAQVLNYDDRLELINQSSQDVEVRGYDGEPYARLLADGTVEVNTRSPSYYLNQDRYGQGEIPPTANAKAPPQWDVVDKTGRFEWHDHRIHFMSKSTPNQVKDKGKRTKVFDWRVPIEAGGRPVRLKGDLYWVPSPGGIPRGALLGARRLRVREHLLRRSRAAAPAPQRATRDLGGLGMRLIGRATAAVLIGAVAFAVVAVCGAARGARHAILQTRHRRAARLSRPSRSSSRSFQRAGGVELRRGSRVRRQGPSGRVG